MEVENFQHRQLLKLKTSGEVLEVKEQLWELCIEEIGEDCNVYRYCPLSSTEIIYISDNCSITNTTASCEGLGRLYQENMERQLSSTLEDIKVSSDTITNTFQFDSKVFPNPFKEQINIEVEINEKSHVQILIIDVLGNILVSKEYKLFAKMNFITLNSDSLNSGLYHVILKNKNGYFSSHKIVKH